MYKFITGLLVLTVLTPFISYAALTETQIDAVTALVRSFGADNTTVQNVTSSLRGSVLGATAACPALTTTLRRGMSDATTNGQVTELQKFFAAYYSLSPEDTVTGYFGVVTQRTVVRFQTEQGISPVGTVGPQTRAKIASLCGGGSTSGTTPTLKPGPLCPAIAYMPIECATGSLSVRYDANGCQNGWICTPTATTTASTLNVTLDASSPTYKIVAAGTNDVVIGAYRLRAGGEAIILQKIGLKLTSGISPDLNKVTVYDGATKVGEGFFVGNSTTASITLSSSVLIPKDTDKVLTIKGDLSLVGTGEAVTVSGHLVQVDFLNGQGVGSAAGAIVNATGSTAVAGVRVVKSFPTVTDVSSTLSPGGLADGRLMRFKISADPHGPVGLTQLFVVVSPNGLASGGGISNVNIYGYEDAGFSTPISGVSPSGALRSTDTSCLSGCTAANLINIGVTRSNGALGEIQIPAGTSRYFEVRGTVTGVQPGASVTTKLVGDGAYTSPVSAVSLVGKDAYFVWSPNTTTTAVRSAQDWFTGYGISGLPSTGISFTRTGSVSLSTTSISVTSPNGGQQWEIGQLNTITWAPYSYGSANQADWVNPANQVSVYLQQLDGTTVGRIMDTGKASLHTYFNIDSYDKFATPGQYYVYVKNNTTGAADRSDAPFTLLPRGVDIKVNGSDGPVALSDNQPVTVSFTIGSTFTSCYLNGLRETVNGGPGIAIGDKYPIGATISGYAYAPFPGSSTAIYVTCTKSDGSTRGDSVQVNIPSAPSSVSVLTPNGGESYQLDSLMTTQFSFMGVKSVSIALYKNDQWLAWLAKDLPVSGVSGINSFVPSASVSGLTTGQSIYKIYITGQKADGTGYVDDKSDSPFSFVGTPPPPPTGSAAVTSWKAYTFTTKKTPPCSGNRYIGYSQKYGAWVGAVLCGSSTTYKLYMSGTETGTYLQIADYAGHGQDQCELINPTFTLPNEDDITSGTCKNCAIGGVVDVQDEQVYARSRLGELFTSVTSRFWADLTTNSYSCGVAIAPTVTVPGPITPVPLAPSTPFPGTLEQ